MLDHNRSHTQVFEYADAHFNLLFGGDGNIRCDGTDPNASGPVGSPEQSFDCIARALTDLDRLGLKLAFHPSDITATNYTPYMNQSTGVQSAKVIGGRAGMGGVTEGGPGDWAWTEPETAWVARKLQERNLTHVVAQFFFHDDEIGDSAATADAVPRLGAR